MIDDDSVDLVGDIFERIGNSFEVLVDLARHHELHRFAAMLVEGLLEACRVDDVRLAFDPDQPFGKLVDAGPLRLMSRSKGIASVVRLACWTISETICFISGVKLSSS